MCDGEGERRLRSGSGEHVETQVILGKVHSRLGESPNARNNATALVFFYLLPQDEKAGGSYS